MYNFCAKPPPPPPKNPLICIEIFIVPPREFFSVSILAASVLISDANYSFKICCTVSCYITDSSLTCFGEESKNKCMCIVFYMCKWTTILQWWNYYYYKRENFDFLFVYILVQGSIPSSSEKRGDMWGCDRLIFTPEDIISVSLEYCPV